MHYINSIILFTVVNTPQAQRLPPNACVFFFEDHCLKLLTRASDIDVSHEEATQLPQRSTRWQQRMNVRSSADRPAWKSITAAWCRPLSHRCLLPSNPFAMGHCDRSAGQTCRRMQTHKTAAAAGVKTPNRKKCDI